MGSSPANALSFSHVDVHVGVLSVHSNAEIGLKVCPFQRFVCLFVGLVCVGAVYRGPAPSGG